MYVMRNTEVYSCNFCCSGKTIIITYSEGVFVVALGIRYAMRMRHIVTVACPAVQYSDTTANEDNSFRSYIRYPKSSLAETHIQTEKISSWNGPTVHICCFTLARASTKTFVSRIHIH